MKTATQPARSARARALIESPDCPVPVIKDALGDEIHRGDRIICSFQGLGHCGNSNIGGRGVFLGGDGYGGIKVEFDKGVQHNSRVSGVTYPRIHTATGLASKPFEKRTGYLDGYPCILGRNLVVREENYERAKEELDL